MRVRVRVRWTAIEGKREEKGNREGVRDRELEEMEKER